MIRFKFWALDPNDATRWRMALNFELIAILNPNWHEAGVKVPSQHPISTLTNLFFSSKFSFRPRGVMDKAVGYGAEEPWFDSGLGQSFFQI